MTEDMKTEAGSSHLVLGEGLASQSQPSGDADNGAPTQSHDTGKVRPMRAVVFDISTLWSRSNDGAFSESDLSRVLDALAWPPVGPQGPWLGGGALRRTLAKMPLESDFDFFFRDADQLEAFSASLEKVGLTKTRETAHHVQFSGYLAAATREVIIQCIRFRYYETAEQVIDSFDFTICQFAFDGERITCGEFALWDLGRKRLAIHKLTYPVSTMRRLIKYTKQGFTACGGCLATILRETSASPELLGQLDIQYVD